jgi:HAD superfamily hydrolase (TIGR01509 family)|uniref:HAD family hydrolase n=1 Tax=Eubacterium sp. TaxID=142586 RepID=UPI003FEE335F
MTNIKWLFFDLGSTLVDETECIKKRCDVIIENNNIDKDEFYAKINEFAKTDSYAVKAAAQYCGAEIPRWFGELERLYPDTVAVLDKLSKKYKLGIIANQIAGTQKRIDNWGIGKYFDVVVASAEVGYDKPDFEIFNIALAQANCKPNEAVMIGDRLDNDIVPAKKLGMRTVWVRQGFAKIQYVKSKNERPDYIIENIDDIIDIFI